MTQISPSAPAPGEISTIKPNSTDRAPPRISIHSLSISLRSWIAPMISKIPCTSAQAPMNSTNRIAVMPGHAKVTMPAAMPSRPTTTSHHVETGLALPVKAANQRDHAVDQRECAIEQHQRHQGQSRPDEREQAEKN